MCYLRLFLPILYAIFSIKYIHNKINTTLTVKWQDLNNNVMKHLVGLIVSIVLLNGCAQLPLVSTLEGTLSVNGAIAGVTGKYEHQGASAVINMASHKSTGKTVGQHLYVLASNKYTKKTLENNFPDKDLSIDGYWKGLPVNVRNSIYSKSPVKIVKSTFTTISEKTEGLNYRALFSPFPSFNDNPKN